MKLEIADVKFYFDLYIASVELCWHHEYRIPKQGILLHNLKRRLLCYIVKKIKPSLLFLPLPSSQSHHFWTMLRTPKISQTFKLTIPTTNVNFFFIYGMKFFITFFCPPNHACEIGCNLTKKKKKKKKKLGVIIISVITVLWDPWKLNLFRGSQSR